MAVNVYNNTANRALGGLTPLEAEERPADALWNIMQLQMADMQKSGTNHPAKFAVNDKVYIIKEGPAQKGSFFKAGNVTIFKDLYSIESIVRTEPWLSYRLSRVHEPYGLLPNSFPEWKLVKAADYHGNK